MKDLVMGSVGYEERRTSYPTLEVAELFLSPFGCWQISNI